MTFLDKILLYLLGSFILYIITYYTVKNIAAAVFISFLLVILFRAIFIHLYVKKRNKSVISISDMEKEFALMGKEQTDYILNTVAPYFKPEKTENGFFITKDNKLIYIVPDYKFSPIGADEVAKFYRHAKKNNVSEIWILGKNPPRAVSVLAGNLDLKIKFPQSKKLHSYLHSQNALMPKKRAVKNPRRPNFKNIYNGIFAKNRAKYFALSGLWLAFFSLFGFMRIYYLIMCVLCFVVALICALKRD